MATYRQIHVRMWKDQWFLGLKPLWKLLFVYLFSNEEAHLSGVYELPFRAMVFETGLGPKLIREALAYFQACGKVWYEEETGQVFVRNLMRYNAPNVMSARILAHLRKHRVSGGPNLAYWDLWEQVYPEVAERVSMSCTQEQEQEKEQEPEPSRGAGGAGGSAMDSREIEDVVKLLELAGQDGVNALDRQRIEEMIGAAEAHRSSLASGAEGAGLPGSEWVCEAVRVANGAQKRTSPVSLNFVDSVLRRWMEEGFRAKWGGEEEAVQWADVEPWGE